MSEDTCQRCSRPWCDHVGDGHDEPLCPTRPEHRCPACQIAALRAEAGRLSKALRAADSVLWMAREYAEAGGSSGPEMRGYTEAEREVRIALSAPAEKEGRDEG